MRFKNTGEDGFLIILMLLAIAGLLWLFSPFLEALFFALILATATYQGYLKVLPHVKESKTYAAGAVSLGVFVMVIAPVSYLLVEASLQVGQLVSEAQTWLTLQTPDSLASLNAQALSWFAIDMEMQQTLIAQVKENATKVIAFGQKTILFLLEGVVGSTLSFLTFISLSTFALFFFYRDGAKIAHHLKVLSPLDNFYDSMIMSRFASLSTVLLFSILSIALLQGLSFAILAAFLGLPIMFIGLAIAITSFIPIVGAALIWVPISIFLAVNGQLTSAIVVVFWGAVINGFVIDNILRPIIMTKIANTLGDSSDLIVANHTLITVLSTFAGLIHFGMIGLFFGPVIAALAIAIFEVYEHKNRDFLDRS